MDDVWKALTFLIAGATLLVSICVAFVSYQQFRLNRDKLKLDLFEKRFSVFAATRRLLETTLAEAKLTRDQILEYRIGVAESTFLFGDDIAQFLKEITENAIILKSTNEKIAQEPPVNNVDQCINENSEALLWMISQIPELETKFAPYLKFHVWK